MDLKQQSITMRELLQNQQAYALLKREFPLLSTPTVQRNLAPLTLRQLLQMVRPYLSRAHLNHLLQQLEAL